MANNILEMDQMAAGEEAIQRAEKSHQMGSRLSIECSRKTPEPAFAPPRSHGRHQTHVPHAGTTVGVVGLVGIGIGLFLTGGVALSLPPVGLPSD